MNYKLLYEETLAQLNKLKTNYKILQKENELLKKHNSKGSAPAINGNAYEKIIYDVIKDRYMCSTLFENGFRIFANQKRARIFENGHF